VMAALRVITARNPVHAALFLVLAFFTSSALWLLLQAEFLAITLVLVYVGAVMVLFLFVVMMLDINLTRLREGFWSYLPIGLLVGLLVVAEMAFILWFRADLAAAAAPLPLPAGHSNTKELGLLLYKDYIYPFEIAAVILLVAIVAAIALTLRTRKQSKFMDPSEQVRVRRADRVRMVSMPAEKQDSEAGIQDSEAKP
ncbi:MAG: NADH-quinone oxidoreductase subunit J, partial [Burkholderiales bacterium]